jgi:hypothetical protein
LNITPDDEILVRRIIEGQGNEAGRRAFYLRLEEAQRSEEARLISAKAARNEAAAAEEEARINAGVEAQVRGSLLPPGLVASTSATITRGR